MRCLGEQKKKKKKAPEKLNNELNSTQASLKFGKRSQCVFQ